MKQHHRLAATVDFVVHPESVDRSIARRWTLLRRQVCDRIAITERAVFRILVYRRFIEKSCKLTHYRVPSEERIWIRLGLQA